MSIERTVDVPTAEVQALIDDYAQEGWQVRKIDQGGGLWTIDAWPPTGPEPGTGAQPASGTAATGDAATEPAATPPPATPPAVAAATPAAPAPTAESGAVAAAPAAGTIAGIGSMRTSTKGLLALMAHEGIVLSSYKDSVGVWTIGVGHTAAAGAPEPTPGQTITLKEAVDIFRRDITKYEKDVNEAVKVPVQQHEFDALVSFHYNTGGIKKARLTKSLNAGDHIAAAAQFMGWTKPPEIIGRRRKEQNLFANGDYGNVNTVLVYDRFPGTPRSMSTAEILAG